MTRHRVPELKDAIKAQLAAALVGAGVGDEAPGDVPVLTEVTEEDHQIHVRVDDWDFLQGAGGAGRHDTYHFKIHVFAKDADPTSDDIVDAMGEAMRVENLCIGALDGWPPLEDGGAIKHLRSADAGDDDPDTHHRLSRFTLILEGE